MGTEPIPTPPPPVVWVWECFYTNLGELWWHPHTDRETAIACARDRLQAHPMIGRILVREVCEEAHAIRNQTTITREDTHP